LNKQNFCRNWQRRNIQEP